MRTDTERLDWVDQDGIEIYVGYDYAQITTPNDRVRKGRTLREVIDLAMDAAEAS